MYILYRYKSYKLIINLISSIFSSISLNCTENYFQEYARRHIISFMSVYCRIYSTLLKCIYPTLGNIHFLSLFYFSPDHLSLSNSLYQSSFSLFSLSNLIKIYPPRGVLYLLFTAISTVIVMTVLAHLAFNKHLMNKKIYFLVLNNIILCDWSLQNALSLIAAYKTQHTPK